MNEGGEEGHISSMAIMVEKTFPPDNAEIHSLFQGSNMTRSDHNHF